MTILEQLNIALNQAREMHQPVIGIYLSVDAAMELINLLPEMNPANRIELKSFTLEEMAAQKPMMLFGYYVAPMQSDFMKEKELFRLMYAESYK